MNRSRVVTPLKIARVTSGLRAYEVSQAAGIPGSRYCLYEHGRAAVPPDRAKKLSKILQVPVEKLFPENGK